MEFTVTAKFTDGSERTKSFGSDRDAAEVFAEQVWPYHDVSYVAVKRDGEIFGEFEK